MGWEDSGALFQFLLWNLVQGGQEHGCRMDREWRRWGGGRWGGGRGGGGGWDGDIGEVGRGGGSTMAMALITTIIATPLQSALKFMSS